MEARPFQAAQLDRARAAIRDGARRILIQCPTGGGKTVMAALMMRGMVERERRPWFAVHRKELLEQTSDTFSAIGLEHGWIASGREFERAKPVQLVGIQYAARRVGLLEPPTDLIIDEAHHAVAGQWSSVLESFDRALHIGLSATPERLDGRGLSDRFDVLIEGPSVAWLIEHGYLSPYRYFAPGQPDLTGVRSRAGDFARDELDQIMGDADLIGGAVDHYKDLADGEQGIAFAVSRRHSQLIADQFCAAGIAAAHIDGSMGDKERAGIVAAFRRGDIRIMVNVDLFGEGFDVPGITYLGMFRPTKSLSLCMQQWGRALRIMEGKEAAIICDHAGNAFRHGLPDDPRRWSLEGRTKASRGASDATPIHTCPMCYQVTASQRRQCPCGYVFPIADRNPAWAEGQLFEMTKGERVETEKQLKAAMRKAEEKACKTYSDLYDLALARGYEKPDAWARNKIRMRKGIRPGRQRWRGRR